MNLLPIEVINHVNLHESKFLALLKGDALTFMLHRDGIYEKHFLDIVYQIVKPGDYAVDLGANLGYHTVTLAKLVGNSGKVFAFEPQRITFQQLNCNVFLNGLDNVYTFHAAAGETNSEVFVEQVDYYRVVEGDFGTNIGNTSVNSLGFGDKIPKISLDSLNLPKVNFIKLDIQGCELLALIGARETILKHKPILFVEIEGHHLIKFNTTEKDLVSYIKGLGYKMFRIANQFGCDHLCVPNDRELNLKIDDPLILI